jgi:hypothetical protein
MFESHSGIAIVDSGHFLSGDSGPLGKILQL